MLTQEQMEWVRKWRADNKAHNTRPAGHALKILEEVIELCYASGAHPGEIYNVFQAETEKARTREEIKQVPHMPRMQDEAADVTITVAAFVIANNIDIQDAFRKKVPILESRTWTPDNDGVLRRPR